MRVIDKPSVDSMLFFSCTMLSCFLHLLFILFCCFRKDSISESSDDTLLSCFLGDVPNNMESIEYMISLIVSIFLKLSDSTLNGSLLICNYTRRFSTHHFKEASEDTHKRVLCLWVHKTEAKTYCFIMVILPKKHP